MWKRIIAALVVALAYQNSFVSSFLPSWNRLVSILLTTLAFLAFLVGFVNLYIGKNLRKCSPLNEHLAYVNEETQSSQCIKDLDKVASKQGLSNMWREEIQDKNVTVKVLLTGVTGYVGRAFLFQLLREISEAERGGHTNLQHKVYVMVRPKARKNMRAAQRMAKMRNDPIFITVLDQWDKVVVAVESGDMQENKCGLSAPTLDMLQDAQLTHVLHCAADVNFNRPLADSAGINISPTLQLQALSLTWPSCKRFVHCSTAFVNPGCGSQDAPLEEKLFPLGKYNAQELYESMRGNPELAMEAKEELGFPNNYVFAKCVAEHLVSQKHKGGELKIVRPAVVGPSWVLPHPGWNGDKPSTITALFLLWGTRVIRFTPLNSKPTAMVPVDVVAVGLLDAMISPSQEVPKEPADQLEADDETQELPTLSIRNLTWSHKSPHKFLDGRRMANYCIPAAVLKNHLTATEAAVSFALIDASTNFPFLYHFLHRLFNLGPLKLLQFVCWVARISGIESVLDQLPVTKLLNFSDMLTLYRPFVSRAFFFESSYNVPASLDMNQYCVSLFLATYAFWRSLFPGTLAELAELELMPEGRFDLWWALTLPCGTFKNRMIGYLACKIIRETYGSAEVNFATLFHAGRTLYHLEETMAQQKHCVVLAPTHRSLMDYILAKYIAFSMVGLGIDAPTVYADPEFDDPDLPSRIGATKSKFDRHATLAAFLEGSPSSDGRLKKPRTEFLQSLVNSPGNHSYTLIPLCIDYDRVDNDNKVMKEATQQSSDLGLLDMIKLYLQVRSLARKPKSFGDVRISFGVPTSLESSSNLEAVADHVQNEHRRLTTVSEYQISAAERHLEIPANTLCTAMEQLDVNVYDNKTQGKGKTLKGRKHTSNLGRSTNAEDMWRLHLLWMPRLAPYLAESHPKWASWIMSGLDVPTPPEEIAKTSEMKAVLRAVCSKLEAAEALALRALGENDASNLTFEDLLKEMSAIEQDNVSDRNPILRAAASFVLESAVPS